MSTATLDHELNFQDNQQSEADKKLFVIFYSEAIKNESKTIAAGRPIYDDIDHIKILAPGSRDTFVTEATPEYQMRFADRWKQYKANQEQTVSGTPLSEIPWMTKGQVAEFRAVSCVTAEQLVNMPDNVSQKFMGHHQLKARVQAFLDAAAGAAPALKLQAELDQRDEQLKMQGDQIRALMAKVDELSKGKK